jgi:hypothetical protein
VRWKAPGNEVPYPGATGAAGWIIKPNTRYIPADIDDDGYEEIVSFAADGFDDLRLGVLRRVPAPRPLRLQGIPSRFGPKAVKALDIRSNVSGNELAVRRVQIEEAYIENSKPDQEQNLIYLDEAYYLALVEVAIRLKENAHYSDSLAWWRLIYNYNQPHKQRKIAYRLKSDVGLLDFQRPLDWLEDPLNPHTIADTRKGVHTKFIILSITQSLLDYADSEFARATSESVPRARELYLEALELLDSPELKQHMDRCIDVLGELAIPIGKDEELWVYHEFRRQLEVLRDYKTRAGVVPQINSILKSRKPLSKRYHEALKVMDDAAKAEGAVKSFRNALEERHDSVATASFIVLADKPIANRAEALSIRNGRHPSPSKAFMNGGLLPPSGYYSHEFLPAPAPLFCIPINPVLHAMRQHADLNLRKIRSCRNIAGLELLVEPYALPSAALASAAEFGSGDRLPNLAAHNFQPLPYRYVTLIERCKQLVDLARQMEASMLQFLESTDRTRYDELKARQDLSLARSSLNLKDIQVTEASSGVTLAELQRDRAQIQQSHYQGLLNRGLTDTENLALGAQVATYSLRQSAAFGAIAAQISIVGLVKAIGTTGGQNFQEVMTAQAESFASLGQFLSTQANYERRKEEWQFAQNIALQDVSVGQQQVTLAWHRVAIANQERAISALQLDHTERILQFLTTKNLTADLYDWMSGVLEQIYRFFLQQATQMARLAELQLAFERQEAPAGIVKSNYWQRPSKNTTPDFNAPGQRIDNVRGLTGSARLLRDVYELDQHAFTKNQRKLQLTETISLARLDPFAFQRFREAGTLKFQTPLDLFDRKFPGHYVRLIKRVRISVIALIPPTFGIRATLSTVGPSRAVVGRDLFREVVIQRGPESISLTSPINATGLFELDAQPELLVPFEGIGIDAQWVFDMPKAANPFNYDTIADVFLTIEYTALHSYDYQQQVLERLDSRNMGDRAFSFRHDLPDLWYDLNNPELKKAEEQMIVSFETKRDHFPPNLDDLKVTQVAMYFAHTGSQFEKIEVESLTYTPEDDEIQRPKEPVGAKMKAISDSNGIISTRRGAWGPLNLPVSVTGRWWIKFPNDDATRKRFGEPKDKKDKKDKIEDIIFMITYAGRLSAW